MKLFFILSLFILVACSSQPTKRGSYESSNVDIELEDIANKKELYNATKNLARCIAANAKKHPKKISDKKSIIYLYGTEKTLPRVHKHVDDFVSMIRMFSDQSGIDIGIHFTHKSLNLTSIVSNNKEINAYYLVLDDFSQESILSERYNSNLSGNINGTNGGWGVKSNQGEGITGMIYELSSHFGRAGSYDPLSNRTRVYYESNSSNSSKGLSVQAGPLSINVGGGKYVSSKQFKLDIIQALFRTHVLEILNKIFVLDNFHGNCSSNDISGDFYSSNTSCYTEKGNRILICGNPQADWTFNNEKCFSYTVLFKNKYDLKENVLPLQETNLFLKSDLKEGRCVIYDYTTNGIDLKKALSDVSINIVLKGNGKFYGRETRVEECGLKYSVKNLDWRQQLKYISQRVKLKRASFCH